MSQTFLEALFAFALHLALGIALTVAFLVAYVRTTPHEEVRLIREGNTAAAVGLAGALIGFALVLGRAVSVSGGPTETLVWGLIGLVVQVVGHWLLSRLMPRLYHSIEKGDLAAGIMKAAVAVTLGMLNAASMTP